MSGIVTTMFFTIVGFFAFVVVMVNTLVGTILRLLMFRRSPHAARP